MSTNLFDGDTGSSLGSTLTCRLANRAGLDWPRCSCGFEQLTWRRV
jgi:hypothetical protein